MVVLKKKTPGLRTVLLAVPVVLFLAYIAVTMVCSYGGDVKKLVERTPFSSLKAVTQKFDPALQKTVWRKYDYINLIGLAARGVGFNSLNGVQRLANGKLTGKSQYSHQAGSRDAQVMSNAARLAELHRFLMERNISFLFVLSPSARSIYDAVFAPGYGSNDRERASVFLEQISGSGVTCLDMDEYFKSHGWGTKDVFFRTDHHWRPQAALMAAGAVMDELASMGLAVRDERLLSEGGYHVKKYDKWFLGSQGKRVGVFYGGVDDISVYYPQSEIRFSYAELNRRGWWFFSDSLLDLKRIEEIKYFNENPYAVYLYGDRATQIITNDFAVNDKRVFFVGDSFTLPLKFFLCHQFREVYTADIRHYKDGTIAEYIQEVSPEIVVMCVNTSACFGDEHFKFGVEQYIGALSRTTGNEKTNSLGDIALTSTEKTKDRFAIAPCALEPDTAYTLTVDAVSLENSETPLVQMTLQNLSSNKPVCSRYLDGDSGKKQKWIFTTPATDATYAIYVYAGLKGRTAGATARLANVLIRKGIHEDW